MTRDSITSSREGPQRPPVNYCRCYALPPYACFSLTEYGRKDWHVYHEPSGWKLAGPISHREASELMKSLSGIVPHQWQWGRHWCVSPGMEARVSRWLALARMDDQ